MEYLMDVKNWIEEFKSKYKPINLYPNPKDPDDPEDYLSELIEIYGETEGEITLGVAVNSVEELGFLVHYLRGKHGVRIMEIEHFLYNPESTMITYDSPEELYEKENNGVLGGNELSLRIKKECFVEFWNNFLHDYMIALKYTPAITNKFLKYFE